MFALIQLNVQIRKQAQGRGPRLYNQEVTCQEQNPGLVSWARALPLHKAPPRNSSPTQLSTSTVNQEYHQNASPFPSPGQGN